MWMWPFSEMSLPTATLVSTIANGVLLASLVVGALSTFVIVKTSDVKERYWAEDRRLSNERIADANARASEAELALVKFRAPRLPTPAELASLTDKIKPFAGTKFDVGHARVDREAWDFLWRLEPAISAAGWVHIDWVGGTVFKKNGWPGDHLYGEMGVNNVSIEVRPQSRAELMPAAEALAAALEAIGITATTGDNNNSSQNDDAIHLIVGPKR
jgi:hypothetical protein